MTKIDWERPKFSWERIQNEDYLLYSDNASSAKVNFTRNELKPKEPHEIANLYIQRILQKTNITVTDIRCKEADSNTHIELKIQNQPAERIVKYLKKCSDVSDLQMSKFSKKRKLISFISAHPIRPFYNQIINAHKRLAPPTESELQFPIIIELTHYSYTYQIIKAGWEIRRTENKTRYILGDVFALTLLHAENYTENGELISKFDSDYEHRNFYIQATLSDTLEYKNYRFLDASLGELAKDSIFQPQFPNMSRLCTSLLAMLIHDLHFRDWNMIVAENPMILTFGKPKTTEIK